MKPMRNLSGVYVRWKNTETNAYEHRCFEDLPKIDQLNLLASKEQSWILSLAISLAETLNRIGNDYNLEGE